MNFSNVFKDFPTPKILDIPYAGISLSDSAVRCIQFGKRDDRLFIEKHTEVQLQPGVIVSGQVNQPDELVKVLGEIKNKLGLDYVKVSLPEEKAYLFTSKIPMISRDEVASAVESKIEENVPVSPAELVFDYKLIDHRQKGHIDVVVSALPINVIDTYVEIAEKSGLTLLSLEIESQAITRALLQRHYKGTVLIVHFGPGKMGLYVASDRMVRFTSTVPIKKDGTNDPENLLQEIKKLYTYWHTLKENTEESEKNIDHIILCGESFDDGVLAFFSSHIDTPVALANVWLNAFDVSSFVPDIQFKDSLKFAPAVGLALPHEILI